MGLKERFGRGSEASSELSDAARRERAAEREARRARGPAAKRIGALAASRLRSASRQGAPGARKGLQAATAVLGEAARVVLEVFVLVAEAWMALAELAGRLVLAVWRRALPVALAAGRAASAGSAFAQRRVAPAHGTLAVALAALAVLAISQFFDYRGISVGTGEYTGGVELVAPAPEVSRERAGEAHAWVVLPIAAAGLAVLALAALGRRGLARALVLVGAAVIAIVLLIDMPEGLDEGTAAVAYEGAKAQLLEGFWAQLAAAAVLIVCGLLLPGQLGALRERGEARRGSRAPRRGQARSRSRATEASA